MSDLNELRKYRDCSPEYWATKNTQINATICCAQSRYINGCKYGGKWTNWNQPLQGISKEHILNIVYCILSIVLVHTTSHK